jgi:Actin-fragmin kinase, catalytic
MEWASIESITRSAHGQDGVYFVDDGEEIIVLKAPENPSTELFLTLLATEFGFSTPTIAVIHAEQSAYKNIYTAIEPYIELSNLIIDTARRQEKTKSQSEQDLEIIDKNTLDLKTSPILFQMERLKGLALRDVVCENLEDWYGRDEQITPAGQKFFVDLGKLLVFDVITRNTDRFIFWALPGIGEKESALGNIGNIFIRAKASELIVIDSVADTNVDVDTYGDAVTEILTKTLLGAPDNLVDRGRETIALTGYEVKQHGRALILQGVRVGIQTIETLSRAKTLERVRTLTLTQLPKSQSVKIDSLFKFIKNIELRIVANLNLKQQY